MVRGSRCQGNENKQNRRTMNSPSWPRSPLIVLLGQLCPFGSPPLPLFSILRCQFAVPRPLCCVVCAPPPTPRALRAKSEVLEPTHGARQTGQRIWHFHRLVEVRAPTRERRTVCLPHLKTGDCLLPLVLLAPCSFGNEIIFTGVLREGGRQRNENKKKRRKQNSPYPLRPRPAPFTAVPTLFGRYLPSLLLSVLLGPCLFQIGKGFSEIVREMGTDTVETNKMEEEELTWFSRGGALPS